MEHPSAQPPTPTPSTEWNLKLKIKFTEIKQGYRAAFI
jgi:hypothetical protein